MITNFEKIQNYTMDLGYDINFQDAEDGTLVISNESEGIVNLVIGIADPILIMEQHLIDLKDISKADLVELLQKNRDIIHGAFALDETGTKLLFRDTLQLENLDFNEFEGSLNSLSLLLSEYFERLITISK